MSISRYFKKFFECLQLQPLVGASRARIPVGQLIGHLTVTINPTQYGQPLGVFCFQRNITGRSRPRWEKALPSQTGNKLIVEWVDDAIEICKEISLMDDGVYEVIVSRRLWL